jgi:hypothetical protein
MVKSLEKLLPIELLRNKKILKQVQNDKTKKPIILL